MHVQQINTKNIVTKSGIPGVDFVINPYVGCQHGCLYCYAEFMIRFTGHKGERWGTFIDVKQPLFEKIKPEKYNGKELLLSSVTDPYQPIEEKYHITRKILQTLIGTSAHVQILTKSARMVRDLDLFKQFSHISVGISMSTLDSSLAKLLEPIASLPEDRLQALKQIHEAGIHTYLFLSPYFPGISEYQRIIQISREFVDEFWFENLNFRPHNVPRIMDFLKKMRPDLLSLYHNIQQDPSLWQEIEQSMKKECTDLGIIAEFYFHHGGFSKDK